MSILYKILFTLVIIQFSLMTACAGTEDKIVLVEDNPIQILSKSTNEIELIYKDFSEDAHFFISKNETVEFITHNDYTLNILLDTFKLVDSRHNYIGKFVSDTLINLLVTDLSPNTDYYFTVFDLDSNVLHSEKISTLISKPTTQALQIVNIDYDVDFVNVRWDNGDGENRIVVVRRGELPQNPVNGVAYNVSSEIDDKTGLYGDGNYVVYNSKISGNATEVKINNLEYDNYYVKVFEYNGDSDKINYNTEDSRMNPISVQPTLPAPNNLSFKFSTGNTFTIEWNRINDTADYEIQIATDKKFENVVSNYDGLRIGNSNQWEIPIDVMNDGECYYRVRAIYGTEKSNYSESERIKIK